MSDVAWQRTGWLSTFLIVIGYYFNANHSPICWIIWFVGNILMGSYCIKKETYPPAALSFGIAALNIYGWINWTS